LEESEVSTQRQCEMTSGAECDFAGEKVQHSDSEIALSCSAVLQCRIPDVRDLLKLESSRPSRIEMLGLSSNQENDPEAVRGGGVEGCDMNQSRQK